MREIKFRGKLVDSGEWVCGDVNLYKDNRYFITPQDCGIWDLLEGSYGEVDPETIGQFTGLKDKNGREIYEGGTGTLHLIGVGEGFVKVVFENGGFYFRSETEGDIELKCLTGDFEFLVEGTIHD